MRGLGVQARSNNTVWFRPPPLALQHWMAPDGQFYILAIASHEVQGESGSFFRQLVAMELCDATNEEDVAISVIVATRLRLRLRSRGRRGFAFVPRRPYRM